MNSRIAWYRSSGNSLTTLTWTGRWPGIWLMRSSRQCTHQVTSAAAASARQAQSDKAVSCREKRVLRCLPGGLLFLLGWPKLPAAGGQEERAFPQRVLHCWRQQGELERSACGKTPQLSSPDRSAHSLQQYQSGLAKQQLLSDLQRTTIAEGHLHPEGAITAQRHRRITHEQAGADWPHWPVGTCTRAPHRVSLEGAVADRLLVALYWRGRLSSARVEPITTSEQLHLLEAIGRVRNDLNA